MILCDTQSVLSALNNGSCRSLVRKKLQGHVMPGMMSMYMSQWDEAFLQQAR